VFTFSVISYSVAALLADKHTHTTVLRLCGICPGQPGWGGTRRNIHPLRSSWSSVIGR